jgi:hypothetical protein
MQNTAEILEKRVLFSIRSDFDKSIIVSNIIFIILPRQYYATKLECSAYYNKKEIYLTSQHFFGA